MAILWCDSFNSYGTTADMTKSYGSNTDSASITVDLTGGPDGSPCYKCVSVAGVTKTLTTQLYGTPAGTMLGGRFRFKQSAKQSGSTQILNILNVNNGSVVGVGFGIGVTTTSGVVYVTQAGGSASFATGTTDIADDVYRVIEFQIDNRESPNGSIKVWVDGVLEVNQTAIDASATTSHATTPWNATLALLSPTTATPIRRIDDLIIFDSAGGVGTLNTSIQPVGNLVIATIRPSGAGTTTNFTPSAGSNYQCVDEVAQNGTTDYVSSATSGHRDLYAMGNMGVVPTTVYGYIAKVYADNPGGGTISMVQTLKSGATTTTSTSTIANLGGDYVVKCYDTDPNGSIAWTQTNVDAVEQGFDVV